MSIDARVISVICFKNGGGKLNLEGRKRGEKPGQPELFFEDSPEEVTALNGCEIWGGAGGIMLGDIEIAKRNGYTSIVFIASEAFNHAVIEYLRRKNARASE
jgi:hypothetical protein